MASETTPVRIHNSDKWRHLVMVEATDPVCRMKVDRTHAPVQLHHKGEVYYFCSQSCAQLFLADPTSYKDAAGAKTPEPKK